MYMRIRMNLNLNLSSLEKNCASPWPGSVGGRVLCCHEECPNYMWPVNNSAMTGARNNPRPPVLTIAAHYCHSSQPHGKDPFSCNVDSEPMDADSQRQKGRDNVLPSLNVAIETLNLAKEVSSITPAKAVFGSVGVILTMIRVGFLPV